jgi:hypothetical protein
MNVLFFHKEFSNKEKRIQFFISRGDNIQKFNLTNNLTSDIQRFTDICQQQGDFRLIFDESLDDASLLPFVKIADSLNCIWSILRKEQTEEDRKTFIL